ncbi:hypothetical protein NC651_026002 [Populus alba x Populus x berolinensis]|nr:hypothetical protein NC651_026002 [Populus alba x Populus x berolinensis]
MCSRMGRKKKVLKRRFSKKKPVLIYACDLYVVCLIGMHGVLWKVKSTIPVYILDN